MFLNPNAQNVNRQIEGMSTAPFDVPIPGQSLTSSPKDMAWESPPAMSGVDEALFFITDKIQNNPALQKNYDKIISLGMPIESITNTITFGGFIEGLWSADVAELLKPPVMALMLSYADEKELPYVAFNNTKSAAHSSLDELDEVEFLGAMKENNPEAFASIEKAINNSVKSRVVADLKRQSLKDSFLVVGPEDFMAEEMPAQEPIIEQQLPMPMEEPAMEQQLPMPMEEPAMEENMITVEGDENV